MAEARLSQSEEPYWEELPYRSLVYIRDDPHSQPLYMVAGRSGGPWRADRALKEALKLHRGRCYYCGKGFRNTKPTIDHVEPKKCSGSNLLFNLVVACEGCNRSKGARPVHEFHPGAAEHWRLVIPADFKTKLRRWLGAAPSPS